MFGDLGLLELSLILLGFLMVAPGQRRLDRASRLGLVGFAGDGADDERADRPGARHDRLERSSASWTLTALPLFIWMGEILFRTRLSEDMFRGLAPWLQWLPGRLLHINVIGCGIFAAVSGSSRRDLRHHRQDRAARAREARLRRAA